MCHLLTFVCREKQAQVSTSLSLIQLSTSSAPCEHSHMNTGHTRTHSQTHTEAVSPLLCGGGPCRWTRVSGCHPSLLQHTVGTSCVLCLSPCQMHAAPWRRRSPRPCPVITSHSPQMHPSPASVHQSQLPRVLEGHLPLAPSCRPVLAPSTQPASQYAVSCDPTLGREPLPQAPALCLGVAHRALLHSSLLINSYVNLLWSSHCVGVSGLDPD